MEGKSCHRIKCSRSVIILNDCIIEAAILPSATWRFHSLAYANKFATPVKMGRVGLPAVILPALHYPNALRCLRQLGVFIHLLTRINSRRP